MGWPDIIPVVVNHLLTQLQLPAGRVAIKVPANIDTLASFVRVSRGPGSDDDVTDSFLVDVETFTLAASPSTAWPLADKARKAMHALSGARVKGVQVDAVKTAAAPTVVDYGNDKVVRHVASYRVHLRKQ